MKDNLEHYFLDIDKNMLEYQGDAFLKEYNAAIDALREKCINPTVNIFLYIDSDF